MKRDGTVRTQHILIPAVIFSFVFCVLGVTGCFDADIEAADLPTLADYEKPQDEESARTNLRAGVILGPYSDMFNEAISPSLVDKGYTVELVQYNDFSLPNEYLAGGQTDLNVFQTYLELIDYKTENNAKISAIAEIPTVTMGIFSSELKSLSEIGDGFKVGLPDDSTGFARALAVLESAGIITLSPYIDKKAATEANIVSNPHNIEFFPLQAHLLPHSLPDFDFAVIDGYFALIGGINLAEALYTEKPDAYHFVVIAVRTEDLHEQFVADIIDILRSGEYRAVIEDPGRIFINFQRPPNFRG